VVALAKNRDGSALLSPRQHPPAVALLPEETISAGTVLACSSIPLGPLTARHWYTPCCWGERGCWAPCTAPGAVPVPARVRRLHLQRAPQGSTSRLPRSAAWQRGEEVRDKLTKCPLRLPALTSPRRAAHRHCNSFFVLLKGTQTRAVQLFIS